MKKIEGESTSRGYQNQLLACIERMSGADGICTCTTKMLARKTGATRNVTKKAIQDLIKRHLLHRELDTDETGYVSRRRLSLVRR